MASSRVTGRTTGNWLAGWMHQPGSAVEEVRSWSVNHFLDQNCEGASDVDSGISVLDLNTVESGQRLRVHLQ